jgi:hypothetical protein
MALSSLQSEAERVLESMTADRERQLLLAALGGSESAAREYRRLKAARELKEDRFAQHAASIAKKLASQLPL